MRSRSGQVRGALVWLGALLVAALAAASLITRVLVPALVPAPDPRPRVVSPATFDEPPAPRSADASPIDVDLFDAGEAGAIALDELLSEASEADAGEPGGPAKAGRSASRSGRRVRPGTKGIRRLGPRSFVIRRDWLDEAAKRSPGVTAVPYEVNGEIKGFRLRGVSGPMSELGFRSGDVLTSVNGLKIDSPDAGLTAFRRLRKAKRLNIAVLRGGARVGLSYLIVD